jgi:hypothetical protein
MPSPALMIGGAVHRNFYKNIDSLENSRCGFKVYNIESTI